MVNTEEAIGVAKAENIKDIAIKIINSKNSKRKYCKILKSKLPVEIFKKSIKIIIIDSKATNIVKERPKNFPKTNLLLDIGLDSML